MLRRTLGVVSHQRDRLLRAGGTAGAVPLLQRHRAAVLHLPKARTSRSPKREQGRLTGDGLHPYFGPTHRQGYPFDIPESLRESARLPRVWPPTTSASSRPHNYPFVKTNPNQFVIGIFGGSVGAWFCQVGVHRLLEDLGRNAFFKSRSSSRCA